MIFFGHLSHRDRRALHNLIMGEYLHGKCYVWAAATQRLTGWPMVALRTEAHDCFHVGVRDPHGRLFDARGFVFPPEEFGEPFEANPPLDLHEVSLEELRAIRPVPDVDIERVMQRIAVIWPEIVKTPSLQQTRIEAFMNALDALSKEHGVYIRAPYPSARVPLAIYDATEYQPMGYDVEPTLDGAGFSIDRLDRMELASVEAEHRFEGAPRPGSELGSDDEDDDW